VRIIDKIRIPENSQSEIGICTLDHNRKIIDRWFGTGEHEEAEVEEKDLQEGL